MSPSPRFDAVVLGGGPAGCLASLELLRLKMTVAVVERGDYRGIRLGEHLPPACLPVLRELQVLENASAAAHVPCAGIVSSWGSPELTENPYLFNAHGEGLNLERNTFERNLVREAESRGAKIYCRSYCVAAERGRDRWRLRLRVDGQAERVQCGFVVDATGRGSHFARMQGARRRPLDRLIGMTSFLDPEPGGTEDLLMVEADRLGWWYSAPLGKGRLVLCFLTDADLLAGTRLAPLRFLEERLTESLHTRSRTRSFAPPGQVHIRPADSSILRPLRGDGWLAVGDAALGVDPLSSSGLLRSLKGGVGAARAAAGAMGGDLAGIRDYENGLLREFAEYRVQRQEVYRGERRWSSEPFWQRRHFRSVDRIPITLDPRTAVAVGSGTLADCPADAALDAEVDTDKLISLCRTPRPAYEILRSYKAAASDPLPSDQALIVTLQELLRHGVLEHRATDKRQ